MDIISGSLLLLSVILSTGRNILSKSTAAVPFKSKRFFTIQAVLFFSGAALLLLTAGDFKLSPFTLGLSAVYAVLLISAQWNYTVALQSGNVGLCATVYSFGFIIPTLSGRIFWGENLSVFQLCGIVLAVIIILLVGRNSSREKVGTNRFVFLFAAMLSSGGLGLVQKIQSNSTYKEERSAFVFCAFLTAAMISFAVSLFFGGSHAESGKKHFISAVGIGLCFAACNFLNTLLSGMLDSAVFFPLLNIGTILASQVSGTFLFREKAGKNTVLILLLSVAAILLISI